MRPSSSVSGKLAFGFAVSLIFVALLWPLAGALAQEPGAVGDEVIATVAGSEIRYSDLALADEEMGAALANVPEQTRIQYLLSMLIDRRVLALEAQAHKMGDDPEVKRRAAYYQEKAMRDVYWVNLLNRELTDEALKAWYQKHYVEAPAEEEVHARHILLASEDEARAAVAALDGGEAFDEVARRVSKGPSGADGGDLGYFRHDEMAKEFADAAFALKPGEISAPVKSQFGWHVIKLEDRRPVAVPDFESVRQQISYELAQEKGRALMEKLREKANVQIVGGGGPDGGSGMPAGPVLSPPAPSP